MATNIQSDLSQAAMIMTQLVQAELKRQRLVDTGKLLNSIKFTAKKDSRGYHLTMTALDYFEYLNKDYNIINNVIKSPQFKQVQDLLAKALAQEIQDELTKS
jgi:hypothetical protein